MDNNQKPVQVTATAKTQQLKSHLKDSAGCAMTTNMGVKVANNDDSLKAGLRGPTLIEDFQLREKITHFDHERIPERVVHARGFGAHGFFELYEPMSKYTTAAFLQDTAVKTPIFVRFSTVAGSRGSADTVRDVRGFAVKFYTSDGNLDIVGNNMPVFFIQDAMKFPDIIHAVKPQPHNDIPQATTAHDTFWDFVTSTPETAHMVMWTMSDRAIPRSYRMMEGFGVNTFRFVNAKGEAHFVKYHFKPKLGVHSLLRDEAQKLSGKDPDYHRRDLFDAIEQGAYPEYEFGLQIIPESAEFDFDFDILDPTKLWAEEKVPVKIIGRIVLNKNTDNFFTETEQIAFCPANLVRGIDFSNDPLLQGRLFSYQDTQISRLGGPNFHELPINRPLAAVHNNFRDGMHRMSIDRGHAYSPNSLKNNSPHVTTPADGGYEHYQEKVSGHVIRARSDSFKDFYSQAAMFYNSLSPVERAHIADAFRFEAGSCKDINIKQRVVDMFAQVDLALAVSMAQGMGVKAPKTGRTGASYVSPALSQANTPKSLQGRKVAVLIADGFDFNAVTQLLNYLKSLSVGADLVGTRLGKHTAADGSTLEAVKDYITCGSLIYDGVYVPGGTACASAIAQCPQAADFINEAYRHLKTIGADGDAVNFLGTTHAGKVKLATTADKKPIADYGIVSARTEGAKPIVQLFVSELKAHRHWTRPM